MKRTKRLLAAILSCAMVFALTACGGSEGSGQRKPEGDPEGGPEDRLCICGAGRGRRVLLCA